MIICINGGLFACKTGGDSTNRYTIITPDERNFHYLSGTTCLTEASQAEAVKAFLMSDYGETLAERLGVDSHRISRMRQALGIGYGDGGNRRSITHDDAPDLTGRLKVIGNEAKQIIICAAYTDTWQLVPATNIILHPAAKPALKRWLQQVTVDDAAGKLQVGKRQITEIKRLLAILGR